MISKTVKTCVVTLAAIAAATMAFAPLAQAEYPEKNLTFIVPFPPGGASNLVGRTIATAMEKELGKTITVVNRSGAAGTVGGAEMAAANPDGYTIGIITTTPLLFRPHTAKLPYSPADFEYICRAFNNPLILTVKKGSPLDTFEKFTEFAKANPGKIKYYTGAIGSLQDVATEDFGDKAGFKAVPVPIKGEQPAIKNLLGGIIDVALLTSGPMLSNKDGLIPLAVMSGGRLERLPDVPTFEEKGFELYYNLWGAIVAPKGIPADAKAGLEKACEAAQKSEGFLATMDKFSMPVVYQTGADFAKSFEAEFETTGMLLEKKGLKIK